MNNRPSNIIKINEKDQKKFRILQEGELLKSGDLVFIDQDEFAEVSNDSILLKIKCNKYNKILRKK